jgi:hypothetical protein
MNSFFRKHAAVLTLPFGKFYCSNYLLGLNFLYWWILVDNFNRAWTNFPHLLMHLHLLNFNFHMAVPTKRMAVVQQSCFEYLFLNLPAGWIAVAMRNCWRGSLTASVQVIKWWIERIEIFWVEIHCQSPLLITSLHFMVGTSI